MKSIFIYGQKNILYNYVNAFSPYVEVVCQTEIPQKSFDGLILAGGGDVSPHLYGQKNTQSVGIDLERDYTELYLIKKFTSENKPILGICRGLQIINVFFGGTLTQHVEGHSQVKGKDIYHSAYNFIDSFTHKIYGKSTLVNSAHHQVVKQLGNNLIPSCVDENGYIEGFFSNNHPIFATQFHPERMINGGKIIKFFCSQL